MHSVKVRSTNTESSAKKYSQSFFKIILQSTLDRKKLGIPNAFVKRYGHELGDVATVTLSNGKVWKLGLTKSDGKIWFDSGFPEFVENHSICHGNFLIFNYNGISCFDIIIFDKTACEVQYPCNGAKPGDDKGRGVRKQCSLSQDEGGDDVDDESSVEILGSGSYSRKTESSDKQDSSSDGRPLLADTKCGIQSRTRAKKREASEVNLDDADEGNSPKPKSKVEMSDGLEEDMQCSLSQDEGGDDVDDESSVEILGSGSYSRKTESSDKQDSSSDGRPLLADTKCGIQSRTRAKKREASEVNLDDADEGNSPKPKSKVEMSDGLEEDMHVPRKYTKWSEVKNRAVLLAKRLKPKNPHFMFVVRPYSHTAYVPASFVHEHLRGRVSKGRHIRIQDSGGREWSVRIHRQGASKALELAAGWIDFATDKKLKKGDVCVFELIDSKNVVLKASIIRASSPYLGPELSKRHKVVSPEEETPYFDNRSRIKRSPSEELPDGIIILDDEKELEKPRSGKNGKPNNIRDGQQHEDSGIITTHMFDSQLANASKATKKAYEAAKMFKSSNPSFLIILKPYNFRSYTLTVPSQFALKYLSEASDGVKIQLPDKRRFHYATKWRDAATLFLNVHWSDVRKGNDLEEGDVCVFELINSTRDYVLKIHIFNALPREESL